jgi:hypothetical protein
MKIKSTIVAVSAVAFSVAIPATTFASYFPADRQTYTCGTTRPDGTTPCEGADHVTFDSFINNPVVGDERPFLAGSLGGANVQDRLKVKDGDVITVRAYVHNNADPNKIGAAAAIAKNVRIRVLVPTASQKDTNIIGFISASNATPGTVNDTMSVFADTDFTVAYVAGSAKFDYKPDGVNATTVALGDNIVSGNGASLGDINGCFQYSGYVTLQVKVSMPSTPVPPKPPVTPPTPPVVTPPSTPTPVTPAVAKPAALVNTGAGDVAGIAAGASLAGSFGYRRFLSRRIAK